MLDSPGIKQDRCHGSRQHRREKYALSNGVAGGGEYARTNKRKRITHDWVTRD
jgi:hypothetical protein